MEITRNNVIDILSLISVKPSKDYGQNFLVEPLICEKISNALLTNKSDNVLEIGPGLGSLTHFLSLRDFCLDCVDIDENMIKILTNLYEKNGINFITNDVRKIPLEKYTKIIGNLPYNITTELIVHLLTNADNCNMFVFMIQAEAVNRFIDVSGKDYGPASVLVHLIGSIKKNFIVKPGSFYPAPKCNSVVFTITKENRVSLETATQVYNLAKKLFLNRRKTLLNNMINVFGKDKSQKILSSLGISEKTRSEEISPEMFLNIYNFSK